jgi:undecaprenyl-diphosphatase
VLGILLSAAVVALGLAAQLTPGFSATELGIDQDLSQHHAAALTAVAMALNVVFGPVAGLALIGATALSIWLFRGGLPKAVAFGLVASSGWVASEIFKLIVARQRPNPALLFDPLAPETGSNSFPSGHVSFAVALGFAVYFLARGTRWAKVTAAGAAVVAVYRRPLPHRRRGVVPGRERSRGLARGTVEPCRAADGGLASGDVRQPAAGR